MSGKTNYDVHRMIQTVTDDGCFEGGNAKFPGIDTPVIKSATPQTPVADAAAYRHMTLQHCN